MKSELLTFTQDRLTKLKKSYAIAVASGEPAFQFDGYDILVDYAAHLIEDLENHFEKFKKTKPIYRFSGNS
jgi:hypothetical protein